MFPTGSQLSTSMYLDSRRLFLRLAVAVVISLAVCSWLYRRILVDSLERFTYATPSPPVVLGIDVNGTTGIALDYIKSPLRAPYKAKFWEAGQRLRQVATWLSAADELAASSESRAGLVAAAEAVASNLLPFLANASSTETPLSDLRSTFEPGSRGIVISVGGGQDNLRYAGHLITSLRDVLGCELPIQIAYAGEEDLPQADRERLAALPSAAHHLSFLDVLSVFDDETLHLGTDQQGGWATKSFAALASPFEQVIMMDADAVFLQRPEVLFEQRAFTQYGAYLFHDRLLWQYVFDDRSRWFKDQIKEPSPAMAESLVWTADYAEECDSGVVVLDKSRIKVLAGLLHIAWQNTYDVREDITYKITYGDKESWWLGLELAGSGYAFETHYGSMVGWEGKPPKHSQDDDKPSGDRVCSFVIAHLDDNEVLLWYNGGLLKNKLVDPDYYEAPEKWMTDGEWEKGAAKKDMSCMIGEPARLLSEAQKAILEKSIEGAKQVDEALKAA